MNQVICRHKHPKSPHVITLARAEGEDAKRYQERQVADSIAKTKSLDEWFRMKPEDRYHRFVQWSDEDQCYIGYCPDLYFGGVCHADVEPEANSELCTIIREEVAHRLSPGQTLPVPAVKATRTLDFVAA